MAKHNCPVCHKRLPNPLQQAVDHMEKRHQSVLRNHGEGKSRDLRQKYCAFKIWFKSLGFSTVVVHKNLATNKYEITH